MMIRFLWAVILPPCCYIDIFAGCTSRHSLLLMGFFYSPFFTNWSIRKQYFMLME